VLSTHQQTHKKVGTLDIYVRAQYSHHKSMLGNKYSTHQQTHQQVGTLDIYVRAQYSHYKSMLGHSTHQQTHQQVGTLDIYVRAQYSHYKYMLGYSTHQQTHQQVTTWHVSVAVPPIHILHTFHCHLQRLRFLPHQPWRHAGRKTLQLQHARMLSLLHN
jgi:hypothetical protein